MPRLSFAHHSTQTSAAIHAEAELNQTVSSPCSSHEIVESGESPHKQFMVIFHYPDSSFSTFDGKEWKHYVG
jgi:hypothetical protein